MATSDASHSGESLAKEVDDAETIRQPTSNSPGSSSTGHASSDQPQSLGREFTTRDYIMVRWDPGEPANPYNWSTRRKAFIVIVGMVQVINSTLSSAIPSGATKEISEHFGITSSQQLTMPISSYLIGYVFGPLLFGPLSETYGRRLVMLSSFLLFMICTLACALAPNFTALCFFRLLTGIFASSPIVVIGGLYADIYNDPARRGRVMAILMASTTWGPTLSPIVSGFIATASWQWIFWFGLIFSGASLPVIAVLPETYGPVLLRDKARELRKQYPERNYLAKIEMESISVREIVTRVIFRPLSMVLHESIVSFTCLYLSLIYGIFYLFFEAYPIVFQEMYDLSPGVAGLAFLPIAVGSLFAFVIFLGWDAHLLRSQKRAKSWSFSDEYQRLPLAFVGGPALSVGVFWLAWAAWPYVHPMVPMLAGIPFGIGFLLIFMALINYLTDAYEIYAASALAATSTTRSVFGAILPLAAEPMYQRLGIHWATTLLGVLSTLMIVIPFGFIRFGPYLREHSKFSLELKEIKAGEEREERRAEQERNVSQCEGLDGGKLEKGEEAAAEDGISTRVAALQKDEDAERHLEQGASWKKPERGHSSTEQANSEEAYSTQEEQPGTIRPPPVVVEKTAI